MVGAAVRRRERDLKDQATAIALATNDPKKFSQAFRARPAGDGTRTAPSPTGEFEDWTWED